jgi:hypothetical protein
VDDNDGTGNIVRIRVDRSQQNENETSELMHITPDKPCTKPAETSSFFSRVKKGFCFGGDSVPLCEKISDLRTVQEFKRGGSNSIDVFGACRASLGVQLRKKTASSSLSKFFSFFLKPFSHFLSQRSSYSRSKSQIQFD